MGTYAWYLQETRRDARGLPEAGLSKTSGRVVTYTEFQTELRMLSAVVDTAGPETYLAAARALREFRAAAPSDYRRRAGGAKYNRYVRGR